MISSSDIKHIANLSKLEIADDEVESFKHDLEQIVEYVNTLSQIDTSNININNQAVDMANLRADVVTPSLTQAEAIKNAPKKKSGGFSVPTVVE